MNGCTTCLGICDPDANLCIIYKRQHIVSYWQGDLMRIHKKRYQRANFFENMTTTTTTIQWKQKQQECVHSVATWLRIHIWFRRMCIQYVRLLFFFIWSLMPFFLSFSFLIQGDDTKKMLLFDVTMWINVFCLRCVYHLIENLSALFSQENFCRWQQHTQKKHISPTSKIERNLYVSQRKIVCSIDSIVKMSILVRTFAFDFGPI